MLYLAITGAIFLGWSGTVIIGGLYWQRGTTRAAWSTAVAGSVFTLSSFLLQRMNDALVQGGRPFFGWLGSSARISEAAHWIAAHMPDGKETLGLTMLLCIGTYVVISLLQKQRFDLDALLHRGVHAIEGEVEEGGAEVSRLGRWLAFTREHTLLDRWTASVTAGFVVFWFLVSLVGSLWALGHLAGGGTHADMTQAWLSFWKWRIWIMLCTAAVATVVLAVGGIGDMKHLLTQLRVADRDDRDDGSVG
jgi:SSS family solute:Na+ symporter